MNANITTSDVRDIRLENYILTFSLAFLYYDHLITIDREIKYIWRRPKMLSAYLFLANRYASFSANLVVALFQVTNFDLRVQRFEVSLNAELVPQMAPSKLQGLQSITAASPYRNSILSAYSNDLAGVAGLGVTGWALSGQQITVARHSSGCHVGFAYNTSTRLVVPWMAVFAYDSVVFALTLVKTWRAGCEVTIHRRLPIIVLLLRDGAIYFAVMALANLANILTCYVCIPALDPPSHSLFRHFTALWGTNIVFESFVPPFTSDRQQFLRGGLSAFSNRSAPDIIHMNSELNEIRSISATMMSRLMLNLHETATIGIFSARISTLGPMSRAEFFNENISELLSVQDNVGGAGPSENSTR
ncbi:hypothetical protein BD779DRAFT_1671402 [Infundibulicybe gibba]|nr:hypothetical protein BD779DRAFT_1671402 [Infundibulicybe gibba]